MKRLLTLLQILVLSLLGSGAPLAGVATTKHNLSVTGPGEIKAVDEPEICISKAPIVSSPPRKKSSVVDPLEKVLKSSPSLPQSSILSMIRQTVCAWQILL